MAVGHPSSQAEGLRVLLAVAVSQQERYRDEPAVRNGHRLTPVQTLAPQRDLGFSHSERTQGADLIQEPRANRKAASGRHAAAPPPYLDRRGVRFLLFSAIGGIVFLMGLALQATLTGKWHMSPVASYLIQAVASVESSFLLNRWLTWRDRSTQFWLALARFNAQKTVTIVLNLALYAGLLRLGMNYLVANVVLTAVFTVVNYVAGDRLVFITGRPQVAGPDAPAARAPARERLGPAVSAVIPCRDNGPTIGAAVRSLMNQDYPGLREIILIGSPGDSTWKGLEGIYHPGLAMWELETPPGVRDANFKRDAAVRMTSGDLIALVDSDIVLPPDWMSRAVTALEESGAGCVAGGMKTAHDSFWGRYTDSTWIGAKTPRIRESYTVSSANFGARGRKPPILANTLFTRDLYEHCPIDPMWSHGSYEDYEWFWRVARAGYEIRVCRDLFGWHQHRRGMRALTKEYRRSSRGCAYFIRAHRDCPLAKRRLRQAVALPLAAAAGTFGAAAATAYGQGTAVAGLAVSCATVLAVHQVARSRKLESVGYPAVGLALGVVFTMGLVANLIRSAVTTADPVTRTPTAGAQPSQPASRASWPLLAMTAICAVQAALSLTLVWSNTAFADEANDLWIGRLELAHWLHGASWPSTYAYTALSGSPAIYPPLAAFADSIGGLAAARILSLGLMLSATILLYLTASRLIGRTGAVLASALWVFTEPTIGLAFASNEPLSVFLTALSAWLVVQAGYRHRRGEFIAAAAIVLAAANVTAYSAIIIDPIVIAFAFFAWWQRMRAQQASFCTAWFVAALGLCFGLLMTVSHSFVGLIFTFVNRSGPNQHSILLGLNDIWQYTGLITALAVIGAVAAISIGSSRQAALFTLLGSAVLIVAAAQLHDLTIFPLDMHIAYGVWFAAIAAGYSCARLLRSIPGAGRQLGAVCCVIALAYPAANSWESAWERYHGWADARAFIAAFTPLAARSHGLIDASEQSSIAEYYTQRDVGWTRWSTPLSLDPGIVPKSTWRSYYSTQLRSENYSVIALFYPTTFSAAGLPARILLSPKGNRTSQELLGLVGDNSGEPGLLTLTQALELDREYRVKAVGPYDTSNISGTHDYGIYVIWQKEAQK